MSVATGFHFELIHKSKKSRARVGRIHTSHGVIDTPNFVAVGTNGTLKAIDNEVVSNIGLQLMFCNTYHLMLQPGTKTIEKAGGLHKFINRNLPIITDSGGFQVFSLAYGSVASELKSKGSKRHNKTMLKITEDGVLFRSYIDGKKFMLTPESSIQAQKELGADIIIPFDELPPYHISKEELTKSLDRTHRWEKRSLDYHKKHVNDQAMYAVIHGGVDPELRKKSVDVLCNLDFDGYSIGGSLGKTKQEMYDLLSYTMPRLPEDKPNHLLGIGDLESLENCIPFGIDTFDSSYPTKAARHGVAFTRNGNLKISKSIFKSDFGPLEEGCECPTCKNYHRGYLHHLTKAKELISLTLMSIHNLHYMVRLMEDYRNKILLDEI
ncbi:tRNA-guanosine(34) transglycosylase [Candidatus Aerophobetes bacterium]|uniref:Queuine tRNA-ribosyltransferase n=1 Tax=Aerophobetes bacterium TaxID=2030807 RepID=A0A2A4YHZ2_UNCAE|nr:MAG: tRNA-guanosine(34) transglycosylase [Candidatus Aerophobetes bacterium]